MFKVVTVCPLILVIFQRSNIHLDRFPSKWFMEFAYPRVIVTEKKRKISRTFAALMYARDTTTHPKFPSTKNQPRVAAYRQI